MKTKEQGSIHPFIILILLILIAILLYLLYLCRTQNTEEPLPACSSGAFFSVIPLDDSQYVGLVPLGSLNPPGHTFPTDHHYFYLTNPDISTPPPIVPVRLPGDAWITLITTSEHLSASPPFTDYGMSFKPCENYEARFGHIYDLSAELHAEISGVTPDCDEYSTGGENYRYCRYRLHHFISAGTVIGTTGGRIGQWALDFGAHDFRQSPLQWGNQTRIETHAEQMPYTACPSEMFEPAQKAAMEARFSNYSGTVHRTVPPVCGKIDQDIAGTVQGIWFKQGIDSVYPEDPHLSLAHDNVTPASAVISMGTSIASATGHRSFTPTHSGLVNREFSEVTPDGNIYCYNIAPGSASLLLRLMTDTQLRVEHRSGSDCSVTPYTFTGSEVIFVR